MKIRLQEQAVYARGQEQVLVALGYEAPRQGLKDATVPLESYLLIFPSRRKDQKRESSGHKLPLLNCKGGLVYTMTLTMRLSRKTQVV